MDGRNTLNTIEFKSNNNCMGILYSIKILVLYISCQVICYLSSKFVVLKMFLGIFLTIDWKNKRQQSKAYL